MTTQKIKCQDQIQQSHGVISDFSFDFTDCSMEDNMRSQLEQDLRPLANKSSSIRTIMAGFKSPASAFYATELLMGFDSQFANTMCSQVSRTCDNSQILPSYQSSEATFFADSAAQSAPNFDVRHTLQSIVKSHFSSNQSFRGYERLSKIPRSSCEQNKSLGDTDVSVARHFLNPYVEDQDRRIRCSSYNSPLTQLGFSSSEHEKHSPRFSSCDMNLAGSASSGVAVSSKIRIRWTQELHEKFVDCVNLLGGAEKATPKAILKLMDTDGLTIFHVKSHLQKYRTAKYLPDKAEGKSDKRTSTSDLPQLGAESGLQIREALQLQLDVQRRLHEQLEIQRKLQLQIEEQGKQLRMMFDQQLKINSSLKNDQDSQSSPDSLSTNPHEDVEVSVAEEDACVHNIFP